LVQIFLSTPAKFNERNTRKTSFIFLDYYNSIGFRDAVIVEDTTYNDKGNLGIAIKLNRATGTISATLPGREILNIRILCLVFLGIKGYYL